MPVRAVVVSATIALTLSACSLSPFVGHAPGPTGVTPEPPPATVLIDDGSQLDRSTVVGFHVDRGDDWTITDGSASAGYVDMENAVLGCSLMLVVGSPKSDFPYELGDRDGSIAIVDRYGPGGDGTPEPYLYPAVSGQQIEMLGRVVSDSTGARKTLARTFGASDSALIIDLACGAGVDIEQVLSGEVAQHFPATITSG